MFTVRYKCRSKRPSIKNVTFVSCSDIKYTSDTRERKWIGSMCAVLHENKLIKSSLKNRNNVELFQLMNKKT
jgi:hypothetical protein